MARGKAQKNRTKCGRRQSENERNSRRDFLKTVSLSVACGVVSNFVYEGLRTGVPNLLTPIPTNVSITPLTGSLRIVGADAVVIGESRAVGVGADARADLMVA